MQFGRTYEEFEVGAVYKHWPGKTVTEYDDHLFRLLTMNHHPLHLDANYAGQATDFGRNVVVGNYIYSLLLGKRLTSSGDRGIVQVETRGYNQDGTVVCVFRRKVMVPTDAYLKERGGDQPGRPEPDPQSS
jgi:acyl dehydratase